MDSDSLRDSFASRQLPLFTDGEVIPLATPSNRRGQSMKMDGNCLQDWKKRVFRHQQQARESQPVQQTTLFDVVPTQYKADQIDPFRLPLQSMAFYRMPTDSFGQAAIYFVMDSAACLVLYIGETCQSDKRWKGYHDCKTYLENYQSLHHQYGLSCAVNIGFWWDTPVKTRPRQQMEQALIQKWRSPFNKENWSVWSAPFI